MHNYSEQVIKEFWWNTASPGSTFFKGDSIMWHQPVKSTAVNCHALLRTEWCLSLQTAETLNAFQWAGQFPKIDLPTGGILTQIYPSELPKWHLSRFSHFCKSHPCDQHTDRQTDTQTDRQTYKQADHTTCHIRIKSPHLCNACNVAKKFYFKQHQYTSKTC